MSLSGYERDYINNQKRIIRELMRIGDALEELGGVRVTTDDAVTNIDENETEEE